MRAILKSDLIALKAVIDSTELFPADMLDEMTAAFFLNPDSAGLWLTQEINQQPIAVVYCAPEKLTDGTYNLYLIAIHKDYQGKGLGTEMMVYIENALKSKGTRILIVETSGLPAFERTRNFYEKLGYHREATIREFYQMGEDKIVFWKKLDA